MHSDTFLQGLARVLNCSKVQVATTGLVTTYFAVRFVAADLPPPERASLYVAFVAAVAVQLREIINAWAEEDVARATNPPALPAAIPPAPNPLPPNPASTEVRLPDRPPAVAPIPVPASSIQPLRNPSMPLRTRLPAILIVSSLIALVAAGGCQSPPELSVYREGLHQIDEPLYTAHLLLMDDAVNANLRTDADRQVIQSGITAARGLYDQSRATEAATTMPATVSK